MLLDWDIHTSLIQRDFLIVINQSNICVFSIFLWLRITIVALVLQLIWYYSTSWVSNKRDLVLVLIFWFRIIKCAWFFMLWIIASNFLNVGNSWAIAVKYTTTVVYVEAHIFPQFLGNSRSHSNAYNLISSKKHASIKWERDWWLYGEYLWFYPWLSELREVWVLGSVHKKPGKCKVNQNISKTSNTWLKIEVFTIFSSSFHFSVYFPVTRIALE